MFTGTLIDSKPNKGEIKFKNGNHFKGHYLPKSDSLYGVLTFTDGTKFDGRINKDNQQKYKGEFTMNNKDYINGLFDSDFNIVNLDYFVFEIDNMKYYHLGDDYVYLPDELEDKITQQKMKQITKQLFKNENINYKVLKQFSDNLRLQIIQVQKKNKVKDSCEDF